MLCLLSRRTLGWRVGRVCVCVCVCACVRACGRGTHRKPGEGQLSLLVSPDLCAVGPPVLHGASLHVGLCPVRGFLAEHPLCRRLSRVALQPLVPPLSGRVRFVLSFHSKKWF